MEAVLDLYAAPADPTRPLVCFDEMPYRLILDPYPTQPCAPGRAARYDYKYEPLGTCNLFLFFAPHQGWRHVEVTERRTALDFAHQMRLLVDNLFPQAELIRLVLDNLNTHTPASLYKAFPADEARRITRKLEFHPTPKHGSWLNMSEMEFAALVRQCLRRHLESRDRVAEQVTFWERERNAQAATVQWRFSTDDARARLARLYPQFPA